jgi:hypothetical protein
MAGPEADETSAGQGHPLPDSAEAREDEIPEHLVREKGHGDDAHGAVQPAGDPVAPDGERYGMKRDRS